tara:strand:+ start:1890 stop:2780 length:891 start_codon:yes stop_codon:yes gene_type:complete
MLNRRHIRTLVIQSVYANSIDLIDSKSLKTYISNSSSTSIDLLYCIIDLIKEVNTQFNNLESKKFSCPFVSKNPYFFFFNKLSPKKFKRNNIINWDLNLNYIIELQDDLIQLNNKYINSGSNNNLGFFIDSFSNVIAQSNLLHDFFEDQNINWINDLPYVNSFIVNNIEKVDIQNSDSFSLPTLHDYQDEIEFGQELLSQVVKEYDSLKEHLIGRTPNWESDRIAKIDYVILITSIAELIYFPSIPTKVTLNEYIEIAKEFSSPSSGKFVNGVIDNIVKDLTNKGQIIKKGRGLIS